MKNFILVITFILFYGVAFADPTKDQWIESKKTYKDLINDGFEIKSYDTTTIKTKQQITILFITVLQKDNEVFECQEYQTLDDNMNTLNLSFVCKGLIQPYTRGIGT
jgi:hypothetical protein